MSTKMTITMDLNVLQKGRLYYVYDSCGDCITKASSVKQIKTDVHAILHNALGFDATITVGKNSPVRAEPLAHEGKHL